MSIRTRGLSTVLVSFLLTPGLLPAKAPPPAPVQPPTAVATPRAVMEVAYKDGDLSIKAENADLVALLKKVGEAACVVVEIGEGVSGTVTLSFDGLRVADGIGRLLDYADSRNFAAEFTWSKEQGYEINKISVVRKAAPAAAVAPKPAAKEFRTRQAVEAWLKEKFGTEWWAGWSAGGKYFDSANGKIPGLSAPHNLEEARDTADRLLAELVELLEVPHDQLRHTESRSWHGSYSIHYDQFVDGVPVDGAGIIIDYYEKAHEYSLLNHLKYGVNVATKADLTAEAAIKAADNFYRATTPKQRVKEHEQEAPLLKEPPVLTIYGKPINSQKQDVLSYHLVWNVQYPEMIYRIDAHTGDLIDTVQTVVPFGETVSGDIAGTRYGNYSSSGNQPPYKDSPPSSVVGLPGVPIWRAGDARTSVPYDPNQWTDGAGHYTFTLGLPELDLPLYSRLQTDRFRIDTGQSKDSYLSWQSNAVSGYSYEFPDDAAAGHQPNIFHQLQRGFAWLAADGVLGNEPPPNMKIYAAASLGSGALGAADRNVGIWFRETGAKSSDIVLHELTHAAVCTVRQNRYLGVMDSQWTVNEGIADYIPCSMNMDKDFDTFYTNNQPVAEDLDHDPPGSSDERVPEDWNNDKVVDATDWSYYNNGYVFASMLWDLSPRGEADGEIWKAAVAVKDGYSPKDFYAVLNADLNVDPKLLWESYAKHGMNVESTVGASSITLSWLGCRVAGATYAVSRAEDPAMTINVVQIIPLNADWSAARRTTTA